MADDLLSDYRNRRSQDADFWNQTLANIGGLLASMPERKARAEAQRGEQEIRQQEIGLRGRELGLKERELTDKERAREQAAQWSKDYARIMQEGMVDEPGGTRGFPIDKLLAAVPPEQIGPMTEMLTNIQKLKQQAVAARKEYLGNTLGALINNYSPEAATLAVAEVEANGFFSKEQLKPVKDQLAEGKDIRPYLKFLQEKALGPDKGRAEIEAKQAETALKQQELAGTQPIQPTKQAELAAAAQNAAANRALTEAQRAETARHNRAMEARPTGVGAGSISTADAYTRRKFGNNPTPEQIIQGRKEFSQADDPDKSAKPPTGVQNKALNFFNRAKQADDDVEGIENQIASLSVGGQIGLKLPNLIKSELGQRYTQSQRAFTEARLRKDSGAAIPPHEYENDRKTYFVQVGDSDPVIAQKRRARAGLLASLGAEAGPALRAFYGEEPDTIIQGYRARAAGEKAGPKKNPYR